MGLAAVVALGACERAGSPPTHRPGIVASAIEQVRLRETTPAEVRSMLGDPDEQATDGSLVYRFTATRGHRVAQERETVRFRFDNGKLSQICRTRS